MSITLNFDCLESLTRSNSLPLNVPIRLMLYFSPISSYNGSMTLEDYESLQGRLQNIRYENWSPTPCLHRLNQVHLGESNGSRSKTYFDFSVCSLGLLAVFIQTSNLPYGYKRCLILFSSYLSPLI